MNDFDADFGWQRQFVTPVCRLLAPHLIVEASLQDDARRNTDFMVFSARDLRVACRLRRVGSVKPEWWRQFTVRSERPNGCQTELSKLLDGWGDLMFYGFADVQIRGWFLGDLQVFRDWYRARCHRDQVAPGVEIANHDGSSKFRVFDIDSVGFPSRRFVVDEDLPIVV